jgi:3-methyl-2-oxobutanoate hydroxymethyltransferase
MTAVSKKVRAPDLTVMKKRGQRIVMLTAYDAAMTKIFDRAGIDVLLVGDSLGQVILGFDTTVPVTLDAVIHHTRAVVRSSQRALVVADMPFLSYQVTTAEAMRNAARLFQEGGTSAVKLEGGREIAETVRRLTCAGLPVMGHLGLTPQHVHRLGGMRQQARNDDAIQRLLDDALALEDAGAFALVLEAIPAEVAHTLTVKLRIPTIGIGAGRIVTVRSLSVMTFSGCSTRSCPRSSRGTRDWERRSGRPWRNMPKTCAAEPSRKLRGASELLRALNPLTTDMIELVLIRAGCRRTTGRSRISRIDFPSQRQQTQIETLSSQL